MTGRALIEPSFGQEKQAMGLATRWQRWWEAQQMVLLLARLAHHLRLGEVVAHSGAHHPAAAAGLWLGAVAPRCLGGAGGYLVAAWLDG
jgi:hypothetical protein